MYLVVDATGFLGPNIHEEIKRKEENTNALGNRRKDGTMALGLSKETIKDILTDKADGKLFDEYLQKAADDPKYDGPKFNNLAELRASKDTAVLVYCLRMLRKKYF